MEQGQSVSAILFIKEKQGLQELSLGFRNKSYSAKRLQESEQLLGPFGLDEEESSASIFCVKYYKHTSDETLNEPSHAATRKISLHGKTAGCSFTTHTETKFIRRVTVFNSASI